MSVFITVNNALKFKTPEANMITALYPTQAILSLWICRNTSHTLIHTITYHLVIRSQTKF
jgi:hypothetical protein